jgi:hypothetical protein
MNSRDNLWLDFAEIYDLISKVKKHLHPRSMVCEDCLANYKQAADLYNGDFLAGFSLRDSPEFDNWQYFQTVELHEKLEEFIINLLNGIQKNMNLIKPSTMPDIGCNWTNLMRKPTGH